MLRLPRSFALALGLLLGSTVASAAEANHGPERPRDDDALQLTVPFQVGLVGYLPRARIGLQYGRRLHRGHWLMVGGAALLDRGDHATFGERPCGRREFPGEGICEPGTVAGGEASIGYAHWFALDHRPRLFPVVRVAALGGWWRYPKATGLFQHQDRDQSWMLGGRTGSGLRGLVHPRLALGFDVNATVALARHLDAPVYEYATWSSSVLLGLEVLTALEYLF